MNDVAYAPGRLTARWLPSADGPFLLVKDRDVVVATGWKRLGAAIPIGASEDPQLDEALAARLRSALDGTPEAFHDVALPEGTDFQQACWEGARRIPAGRTLDYGRLAESIGHPGASRAVGQAMRRNPIPIIVPCHRVVGRNGALGGFSGTMQAGQPAVVIKARLLREEQRWRTGNHADLG